MDNILELNVRNNDIYVAKEIRSFLTYPVNGLAPCCLNEAEDSVNFLFDTNGLVPATEILNKTKWEQLRFLYNCAVLNKLSYEYDFDLNLDNLMIDINLLPQLLIRDAKKPDGISFLEIYKALIASVLLQKYKYEDYLNGGQDLYKKSKLLTELLALESVDAIKEQLFNEYTAATEDIEQRKMLVSRKNVILSRIAIPLLVICLTASLFIGGNMLFFSIPFQNSVVAASLAYINNDVLSVQQTLRNYNINRMSEETRHFLSRSYVSTEALTHTQIENILQGLTRMTEPILFDYWILLGRLQFMDAIDIAQRLGDDELLLFAYLKYEVYVRNDISIPGEERMALLSNIESNINNLNSARSEAAASLLLP